jgi:hypothetical protein
MSVGGKRHGATKEQVVSRRPERPTSGRKRSRRCEGGPSGTKDEWSVGGPKASVRRMSRDVLVPTPAAASAERDKNSMSLDGEFLSKMAATTARDSKRPSWEWGSEDTNARSTAKHKRQRRSRSPARKDAKYLRQASAAPSRTTLSICDQHRPKQATPPRLHPRDHRHRNKLPSSPGPPRDASL